jgi:aspartate kinase
MALYVQKFGGTSVGDPRRIARCAARVRARVEAGDRVVVVASAMGHSTDELIALAGEVTDRPDRRELDFLMATGEQVSVALLAMALDRSGVPATALTGAQAGIVTDGDYGRARVVRVDRTRLDRELEAGRVPVVCGFQGESEDGELTTLGRGGSDTTAVAIAAALGTSARSSPTSTASTRPIRGSCRRRPGSPASATRRCSSSPCSARR